FRAEPPRRAQQPVPLCIRQIPPPTPRLRLHGGSGAARQRARAGRSARAPAVPGPEPCSERRVPSRARRARDRQSRAARLAGAAGRGCALPRERRVDGPGSGSGGVRPGGGQRQLRAARRAAGGRAARAGAMIRRLLPWLTLAGWGGRRAGGDAARDVRVGSTLLGTVPLRYVGPCQVGWGRLVRVAVLSVTLATGGSLRIRISVDSVLIPVTGVPLALTNLSPALILVAP